MVAFFAGALGNPAGAGRTGRLPYASVAGFRQIRVHFCNAASI